MKPRLLSKELRLVEVQQVTMKEGGSFTTNPVHITLGYPFEGRVSSKNPDHYLLLINKRSIPIDSTKEEMEQLYNDFDS